MRFLLLAPLLLTATLFAQSKIPKGPEPGSSIPEFSAVDQTGRARKLADLTGPKGLMLVFFRSADW